MKANGLLFLILASWVTFGHAQSSKYLTYEQFGAVGDGKTDDLKAIAATHQAANEQGLPVRADDSKTYYIGGGATTVVIQTSVDFGKARFVIDDVNTETYGAPIFRVESTLKPVKIEGVKTLRREQSSLGVSLPQRSLVYSENNKRRVYIRMGLNQNNGTPLKEVFLANSKGRVDKATPITWDYDEVTSLVAYPIDKEKLIVRGGYFTTIANQAESKYNYRGRGFVITRSNVRIEGLTHYVTGELDHGAPYSGFLTLDHCADVTVTNCLLTGHKTYSTIGSAGKPVSMGSYDMQAGYCVNILFEHCRQTNSIDDRTYWGLFASNFCKNLQMNDMVISRFDAHMGVANVLLRNCTFGHMGVQAVGFGTMLMENCEIHRNTMLWLRDDYGSTWDGDIVLRNCTLKPLTDSNTLTLVSGRNNGKHDFGYECRMPRQIVVKNLLVDDSAITSPRYQGPTVTGNFGRDEKDPALLPFKPVEKIVLKGIKVKSGKELR